MNNAAVRLAWTVIVVGGFQSYLTDMLKKSGMSDTQATCVSDAFMENVDVAPCVQNS